MQNSTYKRPMDAQVHPICTPPASDLEGRYFRERHLRTLFRCILITMLVCAGSNSVADKLRGPLRAHPENPRYFTDDGERAVLLTGSHTWNLLADMGPSDPPPALDFEAYLDWMADLKHNFIRGWTWHLVSWDTTANGKWGKDHVHVVAPMPWARTGPGKALDGKPKFDLTRYNDAYFKRLRERVRMAGARGIFHSVMLFEGWGTQFSPGAHEASPFHPENNINGIDGDADGDEKTLDIQTLGIPEVTKIQEAYVRKTVDTVNDLDNVLYEIGNETHPGSTAWQYHMIEYIHAYEQTKPKQHPVGMTFQYKGGSNKMLFESPADWISPNNEGGYRDNPPADTRGKVVISDTDHLWGIGGNTAWAWKTFMRGLNPIFMDPYDGVVLGNAFDPQFQELRKTLGYIRSYSERVNLAAMRPRGDLASSGYCLAEPGRAYLVFSPQGRKVEVDLGGPGRTYAVEWFAPATGKTQAGDPVRGGGKKTLVGPFDGGVLCLEARTE